MNPPEITHESIAEGTSRVTREQQAVAELGSTRFSSGVRDALVIVFVLTIIAVPIAESIGDVRANVATRGEMIARGVDVSQLPGRRPRALDVLNFLPAWQQVASARGARDLVELLPRPSRLRGYEDRLVVNSAVGKLIRPWIQWCLTGWLGTGSEKVIVGRDGWLFYRDGVQYLTGPGFLDADQLARRSPSNDETPDPLGAIVQFHDELQRMGISLVVFPVPDKAMIRPDSFSPLSREVLAGIQNPSWDAFRAQLQVRGIPLLDVAGEMFTEETRGNAQFLRTDSHWSPAGVDVAARALATFLTRQVAISAGDRVRYARQPVDFAARGDMLGLLALPRSLEERVYPTERLTAQRVVTQSGADWQPDASGDLLLIGDSFLGIYSGQAAGLAEQLSYHLQHPVDRVASTLWGSEYGVRKALGDTLQSLHVGAKGRKTVIWEFAIRALTTDGWRLLR